MFLVDLGGSAINADASVLDRLFPGIRVGGSKIYAAIPRRKLCASVDEHEQLAHSRHRTVTSRFDVDPQIAPVLGGRVLRGAGASAQHHRRNGDHKPPGAGRTTRLALKRH